MDTELNIRPPVFVLPSYSLTGDLVAFMRCGLQYRYQGIGRLPARHPVQLWFGQFIHGVLEESYRRYEADREAKVDNPPPWAPDALNEIRDLIKKRLRARGLAPWDDNLEKLGDLRANSAINEMGPELFPLIRHAEVRLTGARQLPTDAELEKYKFRDVDRYEVLGVVDVITNVQLHDQSLQQNLLVNIILEHLQQTLPQEFEVIIDYKGMRRPPIKGSSGPSFWDIYGWQLQTYAFLREKQPGSLPPVAGALIYLNELVPTKDDIVTMKQEIKSGTTDVMPTPGDAVDKLLSSWKPKDPVPDLPIEFRLRRALRVIEVTEQSIAHAVAEFDKVVKRIEICRGKEVQSGQVMASWEKNSADPNTCTACDSQTFCPSYTNSSHPEIPAVRDRP